MSEEPNLPAVRDEATMLPWEGKRLRIGTTLDPIKTFQVINQTEQLDTIGERVITVTDVVAHIVTILDDKTGAEQEKWRTVLVCKDGKAYATTSEGILDSVSDLAQLYGPPRWPDGIKVRLLIPKTRRGFRVFKLIPA